VCQVVRVWFCNRRQKEKRMLSGALSAAGGGSLMLSDPGSADTGSDLRDDCSPTSRSSSGDDLAAAAAAADVDTRNGLPPASIYGAPPSNTIDYCNVALSAPPPPRRDYCSPAIDPGVFSTHASSEVGLSSYACAVSAGWPSHLRSPQLASLMVAAAAGAMLPTDSHAASSLAMWTTHPRVCLHTIQNSLSGYLSYSLPYSKSPHLPTDSISVAVLGLGRRGLCPPPLNFAPAPQFRCHQWFFAKITQISNLFAFPNFRKMAKFQICGLRWTSKSQKCFSFRGASPPGPLTRGSAPGSCWGRYPRYRLALPRSPWGRALLPPDSAG